MRDIHIGIGAVIGGIIIWVAGTLIVNWLTKQGITTRIKVQTERLSGDQNANLTGACVITNYRYGAPALIHKTRMVGRRTICVDTCRAV